ncbi:MAG: ferritin family protein [Candidatus Nanoarchaeia archaeon]
MNNIKDALKMAIDLEKKGYDIYKRAAEKTNNKLGKLTLEAIAEKELDHIKAIEKYMNSIGIDISGVNQAISLINIKDKKDYIIPIMENLKVGLGAISKEDTTLEETYKVAMQLERDSFSLYKRLANQAEDESSRRFFEFLMKEEDTHYEILQETLDYLNHPADWFKNNERWIVEGG